ncbi:MAG: DNA methyltransferase [Actinomycetota bacterium]|nr:DNA methyltransferase [Actinomycetota bacterium]MDA8355346.1 DNA methyltransferase [Actinomycetota bacterium]
MTGQGQKQRSEGEVLPARPQRLLDSPPPSLQERASWVEVTAGHPELIEVPRKADTGYLTHGLFRYVGKLPPPLVAYLLDRYTTAGDVILDPMCGGGTTAVEAASSKRPSVNFDLNPVSRLVTAAVATPIDEGSIESLARRTIEEWRPLLPPEALRKYFSDDAYGLIATGLHLAESPAETALILSIARTASFANTKKINTVVDRQKVPRPPIDLLKRATRTFEEGFSALRATDPVHSTVAPAEADNLPLDHESVNFVLLHPPYVTNTAFSEVTHLQLLLLGFAPSAIQKRELAYRGSYFHVPNGLKKYIIGWAKILGEANRVVRRGGHIAVVIGDGSIDHVRIPMGTITAEFGADLGLKLIQRSEHRLNNQTGWTLSRRMSSQHLLVFER